MPAIGTAEVASDPMPPNISDGYIMLKPQKDWPDPNKTKDELIEELTAAVAEDPGQQLRDVAADPAAFQRAHLGVRSDVGVKIFGDDMDVLLATAAENRRRARARCPAPRM